MRHERQVGRQRERRGLRVRNRLKRDATRPRLSVFRSHQNFYVQIIDDAAGRTLVVGQHAKISSFAAKYVTAATRRPRPRWARPSPSGRWKPASRRSSSTAASTSITAAWPRWPTPPEKRDWCFSEVAVVSFSGA